MQVGRLAEVWRHPVKSLGGESLDSCPVDARGLRGDRWWALRDSDGKLGSGKSTRRFRAMPRLLELSAYLVDDRPEVRLPDGTVAAGDEAGLEALLSGWVGRPVTLVTESFDPHQDEAPVHLVATASLAWLAERHGGGVDVRRMRPNLVLSTDEPLVEESWVGRSLRIGDQVVLRVTHRTERCVMTTQSQAGLRGEPHLLHTISDSNDLCFGVHADVVRTGTVRRGDPVLLLERDDATRATAPDVEGRTWLT